MTLLLASSKRREDIVTVQRYTVNAFNHLELAVLGNDKCNENVK
jgi:hypothetical protein